jgi:glutathione S-transferase
MPRPISREEFDEALRRFAEEEKSVSGQCLTCLTVQRRQRRDERLGPGEPISQGGARADMKLIIGNKNYSSWSLRGWLAVKQSGLHFDELTVPIMGEEWEQLKQDMGEVQPSSGKVPILWDGDVVIWDSLAIMEYLGDKVGRERFWPKDPAARGMARSMVAEMHSGYQSLRRELPMNIRRRVELARLSDDTGHDIVRILQLWAEARARYGSAGPYLFGTFGAADIFYAPVVTRFATYSIGVPGFAQSYMEAITEHAWMREWCGAAEDEAWVIEQYERVG